MMPLLNAAISGPPLILTEHNVGEVADLYTRCTEYFMLQDGEPATLADALELFRDVPEERSSADQIVMGWRGESGLLAMAAVLHD